MTLNALGQHSLNAHFEAEDLVVRRAGEVVELQTVRIVAVLFTTQCSRLIHFRYREGNGAFVSLLDYAVLFGHTDLASEVAACGCICSLRFVRFLYRAFSRIFRILDGSYKPWSRATVDLESRGQIWQLLLFGPSGWNGLDLAMFIQLLQRGP